MSMCQMDDIPDQELAADGEYTVMLDRLELRDGKDDESLPYVSASIILPDAPSAPGIRHFVIHVDWLENGNWAPRAKDGSAFGASAAKKKLQTFFKTFGLPANIEFSEGDNKICAEAKGATGRASISRRVNNEGVEENVVKRFLA